MAKEPLSLKFAKNVENNRQRLIDKGYKSGKYIPQTATLDEVVTVIDGLEVTESEVLHPVHFIDVDGNEFAPTQYIKHGEALDLSTVTPPNYDPDYLEFVQFDSDIYDTNNIDFECVVMPRYKVKDEFENWTILKCHFTNETGLTPNLYIYNTASTTDTATITIDWGDGSIDEVVDATTGGTNYPHTYVSEGFYNIKIKCDNYWYWNTSSTVYLLGSSVLNDALLDVYINSDTQVFSQYNFRSCDNLSTIVFAKTGDISSHSAPYFCQANYRFAALNLAHVSLGGFSEMFSSNTQLTYIILPKNLTLMYTGMLNGCSLKTVIIPETVTSIGNGVLQSNETLIKVKFPTHNIEIGSSCFYNCHVLKQIEYTDLSISGWNQLYYNAYSLEYAEIFKDNGMTSTSFGNCVNIKYLKTPNDYDNDLYISDCISLTDEALLHIANNIKDNSNTSRINTIKFHKSFHARFLNFWVDENGIKVDKNTQGAVTLLQYIQNKNWTVTFS